jgi:hypothetical protein
MLPITITTDAGNAMTVNLTDWVARQLDHYRPAEDEHPIAEAVAEVMLDVRIGTGCDPDNWDVPSLLEGFVLALDDPDVYARRLSLDELAERMGSDATVADAEAMARSLLMHGLATDDVIDDMHIIVHPMSDSAWEEAMLAAIDGERRWILDCTDLLLWVPDGVRGWTAGVWVDNTLEPTRVDPVFVADDRTVVIHHEGEMFMRGQPSGIWIDAETGKVMHHHAKVTYPWPTHVGTLYANGDGEPIGPATIEQAAKSACAAVTDGGHGHIIVSVHGEVFPADSWMARNSKTARTAYVA